MITREGVLSKTFLLLYFSIFIFEMTIKLAQNLAATTCLKITKRQAANLEIFKFCLKNLITVNFDY